MSFKSGLCQSRQIPKLLEACRSKQHFVLAIIFFHQSCFLLSEEGIIVIKQEITFCLCQHKELHIELGCMDNALSSQLRNEMVKLQLLLTQFITVFIKFQLGFIFFFHLKSNFLELQNVGTRWDLTIHLIKQLEEAGGKSQKLLAQGNRGKNNFLTGEVVHETWGQGVSTAGGHLHTADLSLISGISSGHLEPTRNAP